VFEIVNNGTAANPSYATAPTVLGSFYFYDGSNPMGGLIVDANGNLFGTAQTGGANNAGTVFEVRNSGTAANPNYATGVTTLVNFNGANGGTPQSVLIADGNGDLFGTTYNGGANGKGTVFEIVNNGTAASPNYASAPTVLASFNGVNGATPWAGLIMDANGNLFGTTSSGGANNEGTVFEIINNGTAANPSYASAPTVLHSFNGVDGVGPEGGLTFDANGNLIGTTTGGGANGDQGTVFEITRDPVTAVTISGTHATATTSEAAVTPFSGVTIADANDGGTDINTLTITQTGPGVLSGAGLVATATAGVYTLTGTAAVITSELDALSFTPVNGVPDSFVTTTFTLVDTSSAGTTSASDSSTTVTDTDPLVVVISGTTQQGQTLAASANVSVLRYQWQELVSGAWLNIPNATASTYVVQPYEIGHQIQVTVTAANFHSATSAATNAILDAAGNQYVFETANQTTIGNGLFQDVYGSATDTTVLSGGQQLIRVGGTATGNTLDTGATQIDWGTANTTTVAGGSQYVFGVASGTTINSGVQYVETGATVTATTVNTGGQQDVYGGSVTGTVISGGTQAVYAAVDQTTIDQGGVQQLHGTATNTTINSGGIQAVYTDGTATGTTVNTGGVQIDWGTANTTTLDGGSQYVYGTASSTTVNSGTQYVGANGTASGTLIDGGTEHVYVGGTTDGVTFGGSSGTLILDQASALTGAIGGFQSGDSIDLSFVSFGDGTTLGYQANTSGPAGGTLTITDGTNVATLALLGQYSVSSFALSSDGNGGTFVTDPPPSQAAHGVLAASL
jgi:autotransporter passenger strand-loop-strand repeat protein/uncharacterized repeat protein (TIGR03803 family)